MGFPPGPFLINPVFEEFVDASLRSSIMSKVKSKGNRTTELNIVSAFRKLGVKGWSRHVKVGSCRPDIVFKKQRLAVFLDGCFWHMCPIHGSMPNQNRLFWEKKLNANKARDIRNNDELSFLGWHVLRFWEHSTRKDPEACASIIAEIIDFRAALDDIENLI